MRTRSTVFVVLFSFALAGPACRSLLAEGPPPAAKGNSTQSGPGEPITAILGPMAIEVKLLEEQLTDKKPKMIQEMRFVEGRLKGKKVVLAQCGVGKVNAAMGTTLLLEHFRPTRVLMTGVAGGVNPELRPGDIVIGTKTTHHDYGAQTPKGLHVEPTRNPLTQELNPVYFPSEATLVEAARQAMASVTAELKRGGTAPTIKTGVIVTGDSFVASTSAKQQLRRDHQADATEMEGAAAAQICWQRHVPFLLIRSLSDNADEKADADYEKFTKSSAEHSALLILAILERLD